MNRLCICKRRIAHDLSINIRHRRAALHEHAIPKHRPGRRAEARGIAHRKHRHQPQQLRGLCQRLHHARRPKAVEHQILEILYARLQLVVHDLEAAAVRVARVDEILARVEELAALDVLDVALLGHAAQEYLADGGAQHERVWVLHFGDLQNVLVGVGVVDLVQRVDRGELFVGKGVDDALNGLVGPFLQRLVQIQAVERAGDNLLCAAVAGELALEGVDCCCFYRRG